MTCLSCGVKKLYWRIRHWVGYSNPFAGPNDGIRIKGELIARLYKDGKLIRTVKGVPHNKWSLAGLTLITNCLVGGGSGTTPLKVMSMALGTQCSDTAFTLITSSERTTTNTNVADATAKWSANWVASGAITGICQTRIQGYCLTGSPTLYDMAYYNFVTVFTKPDGVSMTIDWTTTLTG
jgi:hypothetical protein